MTEQTKTQAIGPVQEEKTITDSVLSRINAMMSAGALVLPSDYVPANALKAAYFILLETKTSKTSGSKPVLSACSKDSIANSLFKMVTNAWNPAKKQCYFIAYGTELTCQGSYQGHKANAMRVGLKDIAPQVIYEGDEFEYMIDPKNGRKQLIKHKQEFKNIDLGKIKGAYVVVQMNDGTSYLEVMTMAQIEKAWAQGQGKGATHANFTDMMCKKTIISRECTAIINSSDDSHLEIEDYEAAPVLEATHAEITEEANKVTLSIEESKPRENIEVEKLEKLKVTSKGQAVADF